MSDTLHVEPADDLIDHDTSTDQPDCVCVPRVEYVENEVGGTDGWLIVHNCLDGRERDEAAP